MEDTKAVSTWGRLNIGQKLAVIPSLFILAIIAILTYTIVTINKQKTDTAVLDIAGRQRMLNQKYVKEAILAAQGFDVDYSYALGLLHESLNALINGGAVTKTLGRSEKLLIPPAPNPVLVQKLNEQKAALAELERKVKQLFEGSISESALTALVNEILAETEKVHFLANDSVKLFTANSESKIARMIRIELIIGLIVTLLGITFGWLLTKGITSPLGQVVEVATNISEGNLRVNKLPVKTSDEVGKLANIFNEMLDNLRDIANQTRGATTNLNSAAAEILASTQQQAASTNEQASAVQQTTTTVEEISQSGSQIAEKSQNVATAAEKTNSSSEAGLQAILEITQAMEAIRQQAEAVAENIVSLSEKTQTVGEIITAVNDIAEQSNLLALNATIEATAAGEQGRSFTVVANEMKNLADQAKDSTVQVRTILEDIQKGINSSVMLTEEAVKRVESGRQKSDIAEETIRQMTDNIQESVQVFQQIVGATNQQQIGLEQVTEALKNINQATEQTVSGTTQLEKSVANINALGQQLQTAVERYQI